MTARLFGLILLVGATTLVAQVPVHQDPGHTVTFENAQLRILSVNVPPGQSTAEHKHELDVVTISMNAGTETREHLPGRSTPNARPLRPLGDVSITEYTGKPGVHRIENPGKTPYQLFAVENLKRSGWAGTPAATGLATKLLKESRAFRVYDVRLSRDTAQTAHTHRVPTLAVLVSGKAMSDGPDAQAKAFAPAPVGLRQLDQPGQWILVPPGDTHHLVRLSTTDTHVVEIEVR